MDLREKYIVAAGRDAHERGAAIVVQMDIVTAVAVVAFLQLALKHPGVGAGAARDVVRGVVDALIRDVGAESEILGRMLLEGDA